MTCMRAGETGAKPSHGKLESPDLTVVTTQKQKQNKTQLRQQLPDLFP